MKKLGVLITITYFSFLNLYSQSWLPLASGVDSSTGRGRINYDQGITSLTVYNGELIAGGWFDTAGGMPANSIASWDGNAWSSLGSGITGWIISSVFALTTYNDSLIVAGSFSNAGGKYADQIAYWNGASWASFPGTGVGDLPIYSQGDTTIWTTTVYHGNLIAGGDFSTAAGYPASGIAQWNGVTWDSLGGGLTDNYFYLDQAGYYVYALIVYNGGLIAGGFFDSAGGKPASNIALWNGTSWASLGSGINGRGQTEDSGVYALAVYNGKLIAAGTFSIAGGKPCMNIAQWDGTSWSPLGLGIKGKEGTDYYFATVWSLCVYNGILYAGGQFDTAGGKACNNIAAWDGAVWSPLDGGVTGSHPIVSALTIYNGNLFAAGYFDSAGGKPANNIAEWTLATGVNEVRVPSTECRVVPNPSNGVFTLTLPSPVGEGVSFVEVYNIFGQQVYSSSFNPENKFGTKFNIDLSGEPSGVYLYRVVNEKGSLVGEGKVIIAK